MFDKNYLAIAGLMLSVAAHAQTGGSYIAPTISTLSELQRAEIDKLNKKRLETLNPVAIVVAPPVAPAASAPAASSSATSMSIFNQMPPVKPDTSKKVLAIYGKQGQEIAEIGMPNGSVIKVSPGYQSKDFKVISIDKSKVVIDTQPEQAARKSGIKSKSESKKFSHKKSGKKAKFIFLVVGGEFK